MMQEKYKVPSNASVLGGGFETLRRFWTFARLLRCTFPTI